MKNQPTYTDQTVIASLEENRFYYNIDYNKWYRKKDYLDGLIESEISVERKKIPDQWESKRELEKVNINFKITRSGPEAIRLEYEELSDIVPLYEDRFGAIVLAATPRDMFFRANDALLRKIEIGKDKLNINLFFKKPDKFNETWEKAIKETEEGRAVIFSDETNSMNIFPYGGTINVTPVDIRNGMFKKESLEKCFTIGNSYLSPTAGIRYLVNLQDNLIEMIRSTGIAL